MALLGWRRWRCREEYHRECVRLVTRLHQWDVLRANKAPFAFGLETRVPFLDKEFLQVQWRALGQGRGFGRARPGTLSPRG